MHDALILLTVSGIAGLEIIVLRFDAEATGGLLAVKDHLQLTALLHYRLDLGRDCQPVQSCRWLVGAIALHGHSIAELVETADKLIVGLQ